VNGEYVQPILKEIKERVNNISSEVARLEKIFEDLSRSLTIVDIVQIISEIFKHRDDVCRRIIYDILKICCKDVKVAYLGPEGTFTHEVALSLFGKNVEFVSYETITDVIKAVSRGDVDLSIVPFENSLEGIVHETLDALESTTNVFVNLCVEKRINMCLVVSDDVSKLDDIEILYVQPYAYAQCRFFISRRLKNIKNVIFVESTSKSLDNVAKNSRCACLASKLGAKIRGLKILMEHVEDFESYTKFILISRKMFRSGDRTSIIFTVKHVPGALYSVLEPFAKRGINLTMIYSRPLRKVPWSYYFYLEYDGSIDDDLISEVSSRCSYIRLLGSYLVLHSTSA